MHEYMTRAMVARKPMSYVGQDLRAGDEFFATPVDGDYFIKCGSAADVQGAVRVYTQRGGEFNEVATVNADFGESVAISDAGDAVVVEPDSTPAVTAAPEVAEEPAAPETPAEPTVRRRGRPTNAERAAREAAQNAE